MDVTITDSSVLPKSITITEDGSTVNLTETKQPVTVAVDQLTTNITGTISSLTDVNISNIQNNQILAYNSTSGKWDNVVNAGGGGDVDSVNGLTGTVVLDTDDISEDGSPTNKYFTDARAQAVINSNSAGFITASSSDTLTNKSGNVSQFTNDANYSTTTGTVTPSSSDTFTNKSGNISQWTNDSGYLTSETDSQTLSFSSPSISISGGNSVNLSALTSGFITASSSDTLTNKSGNVSQFTNDASYLTSVPAQTFASLTGKPTTIAGYGITDALALGTSSTTALAGNTALFDGVFASLTSKPTTIAGYGITDGVTGASTTTFTNKSGNISQWTNDAGYITSAGVGIAAVVDDTTPQLGGNLDLNSKNITGAGLVDITNTTTNDAVQVTTTEDSSNAGPVISLKRNSASPTDGDYLGQLKFKGENDADQEVVYAKITGKISDASDGTEDGLLEFANRKAGSNNIGMRLTSTELKLLNGTGLDLATSKITDVGNPTSAQDAATKTYVDTADALKLPLAGGTMSGAIAMGANAITGVLDPTGAQDAATKTYVDTNSGIASVVADTTPQLGGNLDLNSNDITGTGNINTTGNLEVSGDTTVGGSLIGDSGALDIKNSVDGANIQFFIDDSSGAAHVPIKMEQYATIRPDDSTAYDSTVTMAERGFRNGTLEFSTTGDQPDNAAGNYELNGFLATSTSKSWTGINLVSTGQAASANPLYDRGIGSLQEFPQNVIFLSSANGLVTNPQPLGNGKRVFQLGAFVYDGAKFGGANSIPSFAITCTAAETAATTNARGVKTTFEFLKIGGSGSDGDNSNDRNSTLTLDYEGADIAGDLVVTGDQIDFTNLPTSDPTSAGRLWNDSGTVKISAG